MVKKISETHQIKNTYYKNAVMKQMKVLMKYFALHYTKMCEVINFTKEKTEIKI